MTPPLSESVDDLAPSDLRRVVETLIVEVGRLQASDGVKDALISQLQKRVAEQADEIARLKGLPARPKFKGKPSGMEAATSKPLGGKKGRKAGRGVKRDRLAVTGEVKLKAQGVPPGSRFKGYEDITVQDLRISVAVTRYRRERWVSPEGTRIVAEMPSGVVGGFGPQLRQFIAAAHFQGQVTSERLTALLNGMGLDISKRQVVRFLSQGLEGLIAEDQALLRTGLETAAWITVDDTSARHANEDEFTTQFGDDRFTALRTAATKSRARFLNGDCQEFRVWAGPVEHC
jgi:hypothetical protein